MTPKRVQHRSNPVRIIERGSSFTVEHWSLHPQGFEDKRDAHEWAVKLFELHAGPMGNFELSDADIERLRGFDLACYCPLDMPCHADVLLKWANPTNQPNHGSSEPAQESDPK